MSHWSRREFLTASLAGGALSLLPGSGLARQSRYAPPDRPLRLAFIGIGNRGNDMIKTFAATGLVSMAAFCDVDLDGAHTKESRALFPAVPLFRDFRAMFDKAASTFDAVVVATADHSHFPLAVHAMRHGKHVYVEKPLAQTFREVDLLMAAAKQTASSRRWATRDTPGTTTSSSRRGPRRA